jgi:hypothetical protein
MWVHRPPIYRDFTTSETSHYHFQLFRDLHLGQRKSLNTAYSQVLLNTLGLAKTFLMKDAGREAEIPPHIEHHLYEMANPDFMHLGAAGLIQ